jgi:hypothetical protein
MRRWLLLAVLLAGCGEEARAPVVEGRLSGASAERTCAAGGDFWPTMVLARSDGTTWVACKEQSRVLGASVALDGPPIALLAASDALWALDANGTLYRIEDGRIAARSDLDLQAPYNLWEGAGALWTADDRAGEVVRIDRDGAVQARIAVGDGPADMAFDGETAWVVNHRDRGLVRIEHDRARRLATLAGDAPERLALLDGALWVTGRGTDLLRVDPASGRVLETVEIGGGGIDVVAAGGALWVPARSEAVDATGFPTMDALRRVIPGGAATVVARPRARTDVHGLIADEDGVWLADTTAGFVYRFRNP